MTKGGETFLVFRQGALGNSCKRIPTHTPCDPGFKALKQVVRYYLGGV